MLVTMTLTEESASSGVVTGEIEIQSIDVPLIMVGFAMDREEEMTGRGRGRGRNTRLEKTKFLIEMVFRGQRPAPNLLRGNQFKRGKIQKEKKERYRHRVLPSPGLNVKWAVACKAPNPKQSSRRWK
jgi:hypothetical protein